MADVAGTFDIEDYPVRGQLSGDFHVYGPYTRPFGVGRMNIDMVWAEIAVAAVAGSALKILPMVGRAGAATSVGTAVLVDPTDLVTSLDLGRALRGALPRALSVLRGPRREDRAETTDER